MSRIPPQLLGMHDIYEPADPPHRREIPIYRVADRIGSPICVVPPHKIAGIVYTNQEDETGGFSESSPTTDAIGEHVANFLVSDMRAGRIPACFLPLQS